MHLTRTATETGSAATQNERKSRKTTLLHEKVRKKFG
jgi:hypothetical protein